MGALPARLGARTRCTEGKPCWGLRGGWAQPSSRSLTLAPTAVQAGRLRVAVQSPTTAEAAPGAAPTTRSCEETARMCARSASVAVGVCLF